MKIIGIKIFILLFNVLYFFIKLFPIQNKITFISRQSDTKPIDFQLIEKELKKKDRNVKMIFLCKKLNSSLFEMIKYFFHMLRQSYHLATSKVIILDSYSIAASILKKKKNTTIIQMWHAMGAFKKFGHSILDQEEGTSSKVAKAMKMHNNYDYFFSSSKYSAKYFAEAFNTPIEKSVVMPLPRVDLLTNKEIIKDLKNKIYKTYPSMKKKINIVYAPTFRKNHENKEKIEDLINAVDYSKYNLILKFHPLTKIEFDKKEAIIDNKYSTIDMISVSDYVITDYSSLIYESAILLKPMFFYCFDYSDYSENRNFYLDYSTDLPGVIKKDAKDIIKSIEKKEFDLKEIKEFAKKQVEYKENKSTLNIVNFILKEMKK